MWQPTFLKLCNWYLHMVRVIPFRKGYNLLRYTRGTLFLSSFSLSSRVSPWTVAYKSNISQHCLTKATLAHWILEDFTSTHLALYCDKIIFLTAHKIMKNPRILYANMSQETLIIAMWLLSLLKNHRMDLSYGNHMGSHVMWIRRSTSSIISKTTHPHWIKSTKMEAEMKR